MAVAQREGVLVSRSWPFLIWFGSRIYLMLVLSFVAFALYGIFWTGADGIRRVLRAESALVSASASPAQKRLTQHLIDRAYRLLETQTPRGTSGKPPVWWPLYEGLLYWAQLVALRLSVLIVSIPLFAVIALVATTDGVCGWMIRRTGALQEYGSRYHQAKWLRGSVLIVWIGYLAPPIVLDPVRIIPWIALLYGVLLRVTVTYYKKHV